MANEGLKSRVYELESQLHEIQNENREIQHDIDLAVEAMMDANASIRNTTSEIRSRLGRADGVLGHAHQQVIEAYKVQQDMDALYRRLKQMELANKRIRECNNKKYYDFEVYRVVRKIVQGVMDNLDFDFVDEAVIAKAVEHNQLENPDYWLTCVLIAVIAWLADERERATRALQRALKLDERKTASFLMVFYLRLHREETALKWFFVLTKKTLTGAEKPMVLLFFSMLSRTVEDNLSDAARDRVTKYMTSMIDAAIRNNGQEMSQIVQRICNAFIALADDDSFGYDAIRQYVPQCGNLVQAMSLARNNANVTDFITETVTVDESSRNEFLKSYIDDIVAAPCQAETEVYDEITRNEYIIQFQGDVEKAQEAFKEHKQYNEAEFDLIGEMMNWIYTQNGRKESNPQMRKNMMVATKSLQEQAGELYINHYRSLFSPMQHVVIDDFAADVDLRSPDRSGAQAEQFFLNKASQEKAAVKDLIPIVLMVVGVLGGVGLAVAVSPALAAIGVVAAAVGLGWMLLNRAQRKRIDLKYQQIIRSTRERLMQLQTEWRQMADDFHQEDLLSEKLMRRLSSL